MQILVIGGMHGNEPLGLEVVSLLRELSPQNVDTLLANEQAIRANQRFTGTDLNRSFPGSADSEVYESRRAAEIVEICKRYDLVIDFHNTTCPDNDCAFIGQTAIDLLRDVSGYLGLKRIVVADYDCLNKYAPNCISVEVSLSSKRMSAKQWAADIQTLAKRVRLPAAQGIELYRFVYRMTLDDRDRLGLDEKPFRAFKPIDVQLASSMDVTSPAYPIFIDDTYTPYNYGGLLNRIADTTTQSEELGL